MKRIKLLAMWLCMLVLLGSCLEGPLDTTGPAPWLCSINSDGTGFRKIKLVDMSFGTSDIWDIYMTKDDKIIFYGEKLWISDTDVIEPVSITDNIYTLQQHPSRLSQSPDGSKLYFASRDKNIHELDLNTMVSRQLTTESIRTLRNPIVSDLGNYITYSSKGYGAPAKQTEHMYWLSLLDGESGVIPSPDTVSVNAYYSESQEYVYYEKAGLFRSRLDGSDRSTVDSQGGSSSPYSMFAISPDQRYLVHKFNPTYNNYYIRIYDKVSGTGINLPIKEASPYAFLGALCKSVNRIFYVNPQGSEKLYVYNPDTGENTVVFQETDRISIYQFLHIAPTWDGTKVYFFAEITEK